MLTGFSMQMAHSLTVVYFACSVHYVGNGLLFMLGTLEVKGCYFSILVHYVWDGLLTTNGTLFEFGLLPASGYAFT